MNKKKIRQYTAILLIVFLIFIFGLVIYFAAIGNLALAISALAFNGFFVIVVYFLLRLNRYIKSDSKEENEEKK